MSIHPCLKCGACCAYFRVEFYWREAESISDAPEDQERSWIVPKDLTEELDDLKRCMKGTNQKHRPVCVALAGRIGVDAHCSIYQQRSSRCRSFRASYAPENGVLGSKQERCDEARKAHGLNPLTREDWKGIA
jgi:uncharacterized protein